LYIPDYLPPEDDDDDSEEDEDEGGGGGDGDGDGEGDGEGEGDGDDGEETDDADDGDDSEGCDGEFDEEMEDGMMPDVLPPDEDDSDADDGEDDGGCSDGSDDGDTDELVSDEQFSSFYEITWDAELDVEGGVVVGVLGAWASVQPSGQVTYHPDGSKTVETVAVTGVFCTIVGGLGTPCPTLYWTGTVVETYTTFDASGRPTGTSSSSYPGVDRITKCI